MRPAIEIRDLGKRYYMTHHDVVRPYNTLRETMCSAARNLATRVCRAGAAPAKKEDFWALQDATLDVARGEVVGIVGHNGAGKSTLLKILSRIIPPSCGSVMLRGRVNSLLEVGTGFHPELTGRENIFLNGSILGMSRKEITEKFDEIVAFAEVDQFLDTPVKRYSSGMFVRLAFAVAAHLDSEILIVDEILSVGDARFQKKCLGTMNAVARAGHTVFFVSHNMQAVTNLCTRALLMEKGRIVMDGPSQSVVEAYLATKATHCAERTWEPADAPGNRAAQLRAVRILNCDQETAFDHDLAETLSLQCDVSIADPTAEYGVSVQVINHEGVTLFATGNGINGQGQTVQPGVHRAECAIPAHFFNDGTHYVSVFLVRNKVDTIASEHECVSFCMHDYGIGRQGYFGKITGVVRPRFPWHAQRIGDQS